METWVLAISIVVVVALLLPAASRAVTKATGRTPKVVGYWLLLVPVMVVCFVVAAPTLNLKLPWLVVAAAVVGGIGGLAAQAIAGVRAP